MPRELPVQAVFMSPQDHAAMLGRRSPHATSIPRTRPAPSPGSCVMSSGGERPAQEPAEFDDVRAGEAAAVIAEALEAGNDWMEFEETARLLGCYGIAIPTVAGGPRSRAGRTGCRGDRGTRGAEGAGAGDRPQDGAGRRPHRARRARGGDPGGGGDGRGDRAARGRGGRASSFRRWSRAGSRCWSASSSDPVFGPVLACGAGGVTGGAAQGRSRPDLPDHPRRGSPRCSAPSRPSRC